MYSLNAPVPSTVASLAGDLASELPSARPRPRGSHTLVVKRLDSGGGGRGGPDDHAGPTHQATPDDYARLDARVRDALVGTPACEARVASIDVFESPPIGSAPVVYLAVESPGLEAIHAALVEAFPPVAGIEGDGYVPHVTVARGGSVAAARDLAERGIDPIEWVVDELVCWDAERDQSATRFSLPA